MEHRQQNGICARMNSDTGFIKAVAMVTMLIDHIGAIFFPAVTELRVIGRIAFPLFCWGIVQGSSRSSSLPKYALRLLIGGLAAQPFYMLALNHTWQQWNVMATLLLGLLSIIGIQKKTWGSHIWAPLLCLSFAAAQQMDYGWRGVLLIILMYLARGSRGGLGAMMAAFCLYWGSGSSEISSFAGLPLKPELDALSPLRPVVNMMFSFLRLQGLAILSLPLMLFETGTDIRVPRWLGYAMYPGHLLVLWLISLMV